MAPEYDAFLRREKNGAIWWRLEDAVKLCAGFVPDPRTGRLTVPTNEVRAAQRQIMGALHNPEPVVEVPTQVARGGETFVEAWDFICWLSGYHAASGGLVDLPYDLARQVAHSKRPGSGTRFESLCERLRDRFEHELSDFEDSEKAFIRDAFSPFTWEELSPNQRRAYASNRDLQRDPAHEGSNEFWFKFYVRRSELEREQRETTSAARQEEIRIELARMAEIAKRAAEAAGRRRRDRSEAPIPGKYIPYPKALAILVEKFEASPEELAGWIFLGPELGGLRAFLHANELGNPPQFHFTDLPQGDGDYISPMMGCWFLREEVDEFSASARLIKGTALIERWSDMPGVRPGDFIQAKVRESRLQDIHPIFGLTRASNPETDYLPGLEEGLYSLAEVEAIEAEDFPDDPSPDLSHRGPICTAEEIKRGFVLFKDDPARNDEWWSKATRGAARNGLAECRVGPGSKSRHGSRWYPALVAGWLVERKEGGRAVMTVAAAKASLRRFKGCEELAEEIFPGN